MRNLSKNNITETVQASFELVSSPRQKELLQKMVLHLHAFASETQLTHAEWRAGLEFLHAAARITTATRSEFSLMSDVFGLSSMVDLTASQLGATEGSVLGPFHARGSPRMASGANLIGTNEGLPVILRGSVCDTQGHPVLGATVDFWQNADNGLYWQQDSDQPQDNLRCLMQACPDGSFELATIRPRPYRVPDDGPVGAMMDQAKRNTMRPAHFHLIIEAPGYTSIITEMFDPDDPYLDKDAVFGVRESLVVRYASEFDPAVAHRYGLTSSYLTTQLDVKLMCA